MAVIIPHFEHHDTIWTCVRQILGESLANPLQVVVVDDASSTCLTVPSDLADDERLQILRVSHGGPAHARRAGVNASVGELLVFTDADCRPRRGWLVAIVNAALAYPSAAGFTGPLVDDTSDARRFAVLHAFMKEISEQDHVAQRFEYAGQTMIGTIGANFAVRRDWYERSGGFDDSFQYPGGEDYDLGFRIQRASGTVRFVEEAVVYHVYSDSVNSLMRRWITYGRGKVRFAIKHDVSIFDLHIVCRNRIDLLLKFVPIITTARRHFPRFTQSTLLQKAVIIFVEYLFQIGAVAELRILRRDHDARRHSREGSA